MAVRRIFLMTMYIWAFIIMIAAQTSYTEPKYHFHEGDTIDLYANETLALDNYADYSTGNPNGWRHTFTGDIKILRYGSTFACTIVPPDTAITRMEEHEIWIRLRNVMPGNESDCLLDVTRKYVVRIFPRPWADVTVRSSDDMSDRVGYRMLHNQIFGNDTLNLNHLVSYSTHVLRIEVPYILGDSSTWSWYVDDIPQKLGEAYCHQFAENEAMDDGNPYNYTVRIVNKLPYRKEAVTVLMKGRMTIFPFPRAMISSTYIETFSGQTTGFMFFHSGGIKDQWTVMWWDEEDNLMTDEQMADLCFTTDTLQTHLYDIYVRNGQPGIGYYYGSARLRLDVWPKPESTFHVSASGREFYPKKNSNVIEVECEPGDSLAFVAGVSGGYMGNGYGWRMSACGTDKYVLDNVSDSVIIVASEDDGVVSDGFVNKSYQVKVSNCYSGVYASPDSLWYEKSYTVRLRIRANVEIAGDFRLTDVNQSRILGEECVGIRSGNTLKAEYVMEEGLSDIQKDLHFLWTMNGRGAGTDASSIGYDVTLSAASKTQSTQNQSIGLTVEYRNAAGKVLAASERRDVTFRVYNRPNTPTSLMRKGSGASGTMIAMSDVSDANMKQYDYYLVFGYERADGTIHENACIVQEGKGKTRFDSSFSAAELQDDTNRFYVYAQWCYDDGVTITSGKRYADEADEEWDGSDYTGMGGTIGLVRGRVAADDIMIAFTTK